MRVCRGSDIGSDNFLTLAVSRFLQKCLHLPKNTTRKENTPICKIVLLIDESTRWLYRQRIQQKLQDVPESNNIVLGCRNVKTTISQAAEESLGRYIAVSVSLRTYKSKKITLVMHVSCA
jgi:hypothetical protein